MAQNKRPNLKCGWLTKEQAEAQGWREFSGYYIPSEFWMLPAIERDMQMIGREYCAVDDGNPRGVMIFAR